jgi:hypothetical protein
VFGGGAVGVDAGVPSSGGPVEILPAGRSAYRNADTGARAAPVGQYWQTLHRSRVEQWQVVGTRDREVVGGLGFHG